jgi:transcriptional regulator with XRE-family HTH domain
MTALRRLIVKALKIVTPTVEECAEELGLSTSALRRYRLGNRQPSPALALKMAALLRRRTEAMVRLADQLEATTTEKEDQDAS